MDLLCELNIYLSWSTSEIRRGWRRQTVLSAKVIFTDRFKAVLLPCIVYVICASCLSCCLVCSLQPCGHLLGKGWPFGSLVCDVFLVFLSLSIWCPGSGYGLMIFAFFLSFQQGLHFLLRQNRSLEKEIHYLLYTYNGLTWLKCINIK